MVTSQVEVGVPRKSFLPGRVGASGLRDVERGTGPLSLYGEKGIFDFAAEYAPDHRAVQAGAELFAEDEAFDSLYIVLDGWLCMYRILEDGRRQILDFALPGTVLGYRPRPDRPFTYSVEAITDAEVSVIPLARVNALLGGGAKCAGTLLNVANDALLDAFDTLTDIGRRTAREAVAHFLFRMERRIRRVIGGTTDGSVPFPLSQAHIGDALGLTSVHVCRMLGKLRDDGLIEINKGRLRILRADMLAENAGVYDADAANRRELDDFKWRS